MSKVKIPDSVTAVAQWFDDNKGLEMAENLTRKSIIIAKGKSENMRKKFLNRVVKDFTNGQVVLGRLELELPDVYENVIQRKTFREDRLKKGNASPTRRCLGSSSTLRSRGTNRS